MSNALTTLTNKLASRLDLGDGAGLVATLKQTAFKGEVSDSQMTALLVVANQYGLNPWTKEIYAFPDKKNGIIPVVSIDGWARIINSNPAFDGMEFKTSEEMVRMDGAECDAPAWTECIIFRKDRNHPTVIREYLDEVYRAPFKTDKGYVVKGPWQTHPKRFSRHKSMIQCARMAFGFGGVYDQDEAERIAEKDMGFVEAIQPKQDSRPTLEDYSADSFELNYPKWRGLMKDGKKTAEDIINMVSSKAVLSEDQKAMIRKPVEVDNDGVIDAEFVKSMESAE